MENLVLTVELIGFVTFIVSRVLESSNKFDIRYEGDIKKFRYYPKVEKRNRNIGFIGFGIMFVGILVAIWA